MFSFWLIVALLVLFSLIVITISLFKSHDKNDINRGQSAELYNQRMLELESDIADGLLSNTEIENVKNEIQLSLLNDDKNKSHISNNSNTKPRSQAITAILLLILIPVFSIGLYNHLGQPGTITQTALLSEFNNAKTHDEKQASIDKMLNQLEQRLIDNPDDIDGWLMLTNSYTTLERYPEALRAVANLYRLKSDDPDILVRYADILAMTNAGVFTGKPINLIKQALQIDPDNKNALWMAGFAEQQAGNLDATVKHWHNLLSKLDSDSDTYRQLEKLITDIENHNSISNAVTTNQSSNTTTSLEVNVSISPEFRDRVDSHTTLFVFARAAKGPPMPLAVHKGIAKDLPVTVTLDDSMAMMPQMSLSSFPEVIVGVRLSSNGQPQGQSGDYEGFTSTIDVSKNSSVDVVINSIKP